MYSGSKLFSRVLRYLTLSLASFVASVTLTSMAFHCLLDLNLAAMLTPRTILHSFSLSCSITEFSLAILLRQNSISVSGPDSSARLYDESSSSSSFSVWTHQSSRIASK